MASKARPSGLLAELFWHSVFRLGLTVATCAGFTHVVRSVPNFTLSRNPAKNKCGPYLNIYHNPPGCCNRLSNNFPQFRKIFESQPQALANILRIAAKFNRHILDASTLASH